VGDTAGKDAHGLELPEIEKFVLHLLACGDVRKEGYGTHETVLPVQDGTGGDVDPEGLPVFRPEAALILVRYPFLPALPLFEMVLQVLLGNKMIQGFSENLLFGITEHLLGLSIDEGDPEILIGHADALARGVDDLTVLLFAFPEGLFVSAFPGDVAHEYGNLADVLLGVPNGIKLHFHP